MTGKLTVPTMSVNSSRIWVNVNPSTNPPGLDIAIYDDQTGLESAFTVGTEGLYFYDRLGNQFTVLHTGNLAQLTGVAQASLE